MEQILETANAVLAEIEAYADTNAEQFRIAYLSAKGKVKNLVAEMKNVPNERKKEFGQVLNAVKQAAESKWEALVAATPTQATSAAIADLSLPATRTPLGSRHPIATMMNQIVAIFSRAGFVVAEGPEIEDDWHNFTAMNTPEDHPARDMQDTFYINRTANPAILLRTHTSSVQARVMQKQKPPIRIIAPGRVYRNETISARSHCQFHQVEGLYIDQDVSFADLKQTLLYFAQEMFGEKTEIRLRPSFFPFTEPSAEMDVTCFLCNAKGCSVCKYSGWVEILGCGMVDPIVLENCGIDSRKYTGYAFGMGVERPAMLKYGIKDIRLMFENDLRFLQQFKTVL